MQKQKRPSQEQKAAARIRWESNDTLTFEALADEMGVSDTAVRKWAKAQGWVKAGTLRQVNDRAHLKADAESSGEVRAKFAGEHSKAPATASVEGAVDLRAKVIQMHRAEWRKHASMFPLEDIRANFDVGRKAKISSEVLAIRQKCERAAWGLDDDQPKQAAVVVTPGGMTREEFREEAKALLSSV